MNQNGSANIEPINFLVAGFNSDRSYEVYTCYLPGGIQKKRDSTSPSMEHGASWLGQTDVVNRIILGFDPRIGNLPSLQGALQAGGPAQFQPLEYLIQWSTMTLQDGVDLADLLIKTTSAVQRFSDGIIGAPGDMPGVGGEVDIAIITKKGGFMWINKKGINYHDKRIEIPA